MEDIEFDKVVEEVTIVDPEADSEESKCSCGKLN